jgi:hypothetical protein
VSLKGKKIKKFEIFCEAIEAEHSIYREKEAKEDIITLQERESFKKP